MIEVPTSRLRAVGWRKGNEVGLGAAEEAEVILYEIVTSERRDESSEQQSQ